MHIILDDLRAELNGLYAELWAEYIRAEPAHLYHYTCKEGLVGIISTRKLFLSDMLASTDQSEIRYGIAIVRSVLEERRTDETDLISKALLGSLDKAENWRLGDSIFEHAICFCTRNDVLTQWRGYSPRGGFAIGMDFKELKRRSQANEFAIVKMLYETDKQRDIVQHTLDRSTELLAKLRHAIQNTPPADGPHMLAEFLADVAICIMKSCLLFKHEAFRSEDEWRVLTLESFEKVPDRLRFRVSGHTIVPYIELPFEPSLITEIRCSPGVWSRSALYGVNQLAKSLGGHVQVTQSGLPL